MRRALVILGVLGAVAMALAVSAAGRSDSGGTHFTVELDNAFGLVVGSDLKVAGVRAGTIRKLRLDMKTHHALVDIEITKSGFGSLRTDAFCESRPQSLIGEYYLDCQPGTDPNKLKDGATISISHTGSTVPADLLADVMRRPYRERLRIILGQLGVGLAARGQQLNDAIRRASPALRETDNVLNILAQQNHTLNHLVRDGDQVLGDLAGNRADVARWVRKARGTAADSAERRAEISAGLHRLPAFLAELKPTMAELGRAVDAQTPSLEDLDASSGQLTHLFTHLGPFARSTQLNLRSLGKAAVIGRRAVKSSTPVVAQLNRFSVHTPELAKNLQIVLHDLDNRKRAIEPDKRSPGGKGYTGFEALLQYVYDQTLAINIFDAHGYILKANLFTNDCADYQNADSLAAKEKSDPGFIKHCGSYLGPSQQGVFQPDPTKPAGTRTAKVKSVRHKHHHAHSKPAATPVEPGAPAATPTPQPGVTGLLNQTLQQLLPKLPKVKAPDTQDLLDYLLAP